VSTSRDPREQFVNLGFRFQPVLKLAPGQEATILSPKVRGLGNAVVPVLRTYGCLGFGLLGLLLGRKGLGFAVRFFGSGSVYVVHRHPPQLLNQDFVGSATLSQFLIDVDFLLWRPTRVTSSVQALVMTGVSGPV
jgi:hypothetical protein